MNLKKIKQQNDNVKKQSNTITIFYNFVIKKYYFNKIIKQNCNVMQLDDEYYINILNDFVFYMEKVSQLY